MVAAVRPVEYAPGVALIVRAPGNGFSWLDQTRRVSRTATLDGGVAISDGGYAAGDRTLVVAVDSASRSDVETMEVLLQLYPRVSAATDDGVFECAPAQIDVNGGTASFTLFVVKQTS